MKKIHKILLPILFVLLVLAAGVWFFFFYRTDLTASMYLSWGNSRMESGHYASAVRLYRRAYSLCPDDPDLAIKLATAYEKAGNYTKTEYVLVNALYASPENIALYQALSSAYVAQDKLLDAQELLDQVANEDVRAQLEQLRPAAPTISPEGGYYSQYITVSLEGDGEATYYLSTDGEYPSTAAGPYTEPVSLEGGETTVYAIAVSPEGLVSQVVYVGYSIAGVVEDVTFADKTLEAHIQQQLNKGDRTLTTKDLWGITELSVPEGVTVLSDLAYCTGLHSLTIHDFGGSDYSFLENMTALESLDLSGCALTTDALTLIGALPDLTTLNLENCGISNISALSGLAKLTTLKLANNSIGDIAAISQMTHLEILSLGHNALSSLSGLSALASLRELDVSYNVLESVAELVGCTGLQVLDLSHNKLTDVSAVGQLSALTQLDGSNNAIESIDSLSGCTALVSFTMTDNKLTSIDALGSITTLTNINIDYNDVVSVPSFPKDCALEDFSAAHNFLENLDGLSGLVNLNYVNADYNNIRSIDCLANCNRLAQVNVFGTNVSNVSALTDHGIVVNYDPT